MEKVVEVQLKKIIAWIIENSEEREAIDKINSVTFPFTSKYLGYKNKKEGVKKVEKIDDYDFEGVDENGFVKET